MACAALLALLAFCAAATSAAAATTAAAASNGAAATTAAAPAPPAVPTTPLPAGRRRVCIFDFDDTIKMTNAADSLAPDAKWVIDACAAHGFDIAIATAGCRADFVKSYLSRRVEPDIFTPALLGSAAFQSCQPVKTESLPKIMAHYGLAAAPGCGVLFDQGFNRRYATMSGLGFADVDIRTGLQASDFAEAEAEFARNCPDGAQAGSAKAAGTKQL
jgi:hypothetical protein